MLKQIKIRNDVMRLILESFMDLTEVQDAIEKLREIHKNVYDINWVEYKEVEAKPAQPATESKEAIPAKEAYTRPDGIKEYLRRYFDKNYNWTIGSIFQPQAYFILQHPEGEESIYYGTESGITPEPYCHAVNLHPHFLPTWILRGKVAVANEAMQDSFRVGELKQRPVLDYSVLDTDLPFLFFQYLEDAVLDDTIDTSSAMEAINSFYHPEQLGALTTETLSNNDIKVLHHGLLRHKRILYSPTNVTDVVVSTPSLNTRHREPNPSDRKDYRPHRQIASPTYDIKFVRTIPSLPDLTPETVKAGRPAAPAEKPNRVRRKLLGSSIFNQ